MAFEPGRNTEPKRALRAGLIALARGSRVIDLADWMQAATMPARQLSDDEYQKLKEVSVSDEVVLRVVDDRGLAKTREVEGGDLAGRLARFRVCRSPSSQRGR